MFTKSNLEISQLLEEVKGRLEKVEKNQGIIIGHLESLVSEYEDVDDVEEVDQSDT